MPEIVMYGPDNKPVRVDAEDREEAEKQGYHSPEVIMRGPDGKQARISFDESVEALKQGYTLPGVEVPTTEPKAPPPTTAEAYATGIGAGASLGWLDEASAAWLATKRKLLQGQKKPLSQLYAKAKPEIQAVQQKIKEEHPFAYGAGELTGAVATPIPGATSAKLGTRVLSGLAAGAAQAAGESEKQGMEFVKEVATGGALGGGAAGLVGGLVRPGVESTAEKVATKATYRELGLTPSKMTNISKRFGTKIKDTIGNIAKEEKLLPGLSPEKALAKATALKDKAGQTIGSAISDLHNAGAKVDIKDAISDVGQILTANLPENAPDILLRKQRDKVMNEIIPQLEQVSTTGGWQDFNNMRKYLTDTLNKIKKDNIPESKQIYSDAISALNGVIEHRMPTEIATEFKQARTAYGALSDVVEGLEKRASESFVDAASFGGKLVRGHPIEAITSAVAKPAVAFGRKLAGERLPTEAVSLTDALEKIGRQKAINKMISSPEDLENQK